MKSLIVAAICSSTLFACDCALAGRPDLIEVTTGKTRVQGQAIAHNDRDLWLLGRDGRLHHMPINRVRKFRSVSRVFRGYPAADLRSRLRKELGSEFEFAGTVRYLVVAPKGRAKKFAAIFEDAYRSFSSHFSSRRFRLDKPKFPLIAIVFPTQKDFMKYAAKDGVNAVGMLGYYHRLTNRVALYDSLAPGTSSTPPAELKTGNAFARLSRVNGVRSQLFDVIVHEATHQAAFNTGLHSRIAQTPKWVVEGMATVFEAHGVRNRSGRRGASSRINRDQYLQFRNFLERRRKSKSLEAFLRSNGLFQSSVLDAYAQSWALSFYLIENRSSEYSKYLRAIAQRDPLKRYTEDQRIDDFKNAFGNNIERIEADFLRWIRGLK